MKIVVAVFALIGVISILSLIAKGLIKMREQAYRKRKHKQLQMRIKQRKLIKDTYNWGMGDFKSVCNRNEVTNERGIY